MDSGDVDGQSATMEVDGETLAMDINDEDGPEGHGQAGWTSASILDMSEEHKMTDIPTVSQPLTVVSPGMPERVWRLPEGMCQKRVLQKGTGMCGPVLDACCLVTLDVENGAGSLDTSVLGYSLGQSSVQIGEGGTAVSCLIDSALMSMKVGEVAEVGVGGLRHLDGQFVFRITLHNFTSVTPPWRQTLLEKCTTAAQHKEKGALLFKDGNIFAAFSHFRTAIRLLLSILPGSFESDDAAEQSHQQLLCQCYLNLAACHMKTDHHSHVVTNCTQALNIDSSSVKALYRRASANISLGNWLVAQEDLQVGLQKEPNNRVLLDLVHTVNAKLAQSQSQMAQG